MKIINCTWELANLDCRVAEVSVEKNETIDSNTILDLEKTYDYIVIKIPSGMIEANIQMSKLGYTFIENQISLIKRSKDFTLDTKLVRKMYEKIRVEPIVTKEELERILNRMTPNMFSTDRIYLDPYFGPEYSLRRYKNWTRSEFERGTQITKTFYDNEEVSFGFGKIDEKGVKHGILGGLFESCQSMGLGPVLQLGIHWGKEHLQDFMTYKTKVSSNNLPVVQMHTFLNAHIAGFEYVFVKHINRFNHGL